MTLLVGLIEEEALGGEEEMTDSAAGEVDLAAEEAHPKA